MWIFYLKKIMLSGFFEGGRFCARPIKTITITTYNVKGQTQGCKAKSHTGFGLCVVWYTNSLWDFVIFDVCWKRTNSKRITVTYINLYVESILACHYKHNGNFRWEDLRCYSPSNNFINRAYWVLLVCSIWLFLKTYTYTHWGP